MEKDILKEYFRWLQRTMQENPEPAKLLNIIVLFLEKYIEKQQTSILKDEGEKWDRLADYFSIQQKTYTISTAISILKRIAKKSISFKYICKKAENLYKNLVALTTKTPIKTVTYDDNVESKDGSVYFVYNMHHLCVPKKKTMLILKKINDFKKLSDFRKYIKNKNRTIFD